MTKTKTPFFSMGSSGTIGRAITSQKRGSKTLLRVKPTPTDPYSLPQAYQRWLYQDYCAEWLALSASDKQIWRSAGSRLHLTGMSCFLRNRLTALADIAGGWHLDKIIGGSVIDFSKNLNHGVVYGATLVDGRIDHALSFDGVDDLLIIPNHPSWNALTAFTILLFLYAPAGTVQDGTRSGIIYAADGYESDGFGLVWHADGAYFRWFKDTTTSIIPGTVPSGAWEHYALTWDGSWCTPYQNGKPGTPVAENTSPMSIIKDLWVGANRLRGSYSLSTIDSLTICNRVLTPSDILRHSQRRYPV